MMNFTTKQQYEALCNAADAVEERLNDHFDQAERGDEQALAIVTADNETLNVLADLRDIACKLVELQKKNRKACKAYLREVGDTGDKWGSAINEQFEVAEELFRRNAHIPEHWEFTIGAGRDNEAHQFYSDMDTATLIYWGNVLERYVDFLRSRGMNY